MPTLCDTLATHARVDVIIKRLADINPNQTKIGENQSANKVQWSCHGYVPVSQLIYAAFRSKAKGLLPPSDECRRRGL